MIGSMGRRSRALTMGLVGVGLLRAAACFADDPVTATREGLAYKLVNQTNGKFRDDQCFWSLSDGRQWRSFAGQATVPCPKGNGRLYFSLGALPKNFDDRQAYWDFIEYAYDKGTWHGNTTQVDAFCIPTTIELGDRKVGIDESRGKLFAAFRREAPQPFKGCVQGERWILSPHRAGFDKQGPHAKYFDKYLDEVWEMYTRERKTPSGKWVGKVVDGALTFAPVDGGQALRCASKPTTQDVFLGTGVLATNPQFCAAMNRHVLADPADWNRPAAFYQAEPCNWYAKFFHEHSIDGKAYGFCYDDVADQSSFFSGTGSEVIVTLRWDSAVIARPRAR
jgi:hypothetical protein